MTLGNTDIHFGYLNFSEYICFFGLFLFLGTEVTRFN